MIKLYNTLSRKLEIFKPLKKKSVGIYSCGPTVYWNQHIGNLYAYIQWDSLVKAFQYFDYKTKWVMNITDVGHLTSDEDEGEDKMEKGAKREGLTVYQIAEKYTNQFLGSLDLLNIGRPDILCKATEHIPQQIELIKKIEKRGFSYQTKTGLVFDTSKFKDYSKFAKLKLNEQNAGSRVEIDPEKKSPWDFLLWVTNQPNHIMKWESPWGTGFPGWHIECTAMSTHYLGNLFDIHTGGVEHIPIHHTNEIAQGYGAFGKRTANYWLHNGWVLLSGEKISKSLGNTILVTDFSEKGFNPLAFRYLALTSRYRQGLNFNWEALRASQNALDSLYTRAQELNTADKKNDKLKVKEYQKKFSQYLEDNLNMPKTISLLWQMLKDKKLSDSSKRRLLEDFDKVLSLDITSHKENSAPEEIIKLANLREEYRKDKNWSKADETREEIAKRGFLVEDTDNGFKLKPRN